MSPFPVGPQLSLFSARDQKNLPAADRAVGDAVKPLAPLVAVAVEAQAADGAQAGGAVEHPPGGPPRPEGGRGGFGGPGWGFSAYFLLPRLPPPRPVPAPPPRRRPRTCR